MKDLRSYCISKLDAFIKNPTKFSNNESRSIIREALPHVHVCSELDFNLNMTKHELIITARKIKLLISQIE